MYGHNNKIVRQKSYCKLVLKKIMNITIKYKWFYCVIIKNKFSTIFSERWGKTMVGTGSKRVEYVQARTRNKKNCTVNTN